MRLWRAASWTIVGRAIGLGSVVGFPGAVAAQDLPHPRDMGLGEFQFRVSDTTRFRFELDNGLVGFAVPDFTVPLVTYTAFVRAGWSDDDEQGAAEMLEMAMREQGACWMGPGGFQRALDEMAAEFRVSMTAEMTEITLNVPVEDAWEGLRVFSGVVREPCITADQLRAFKARGPSVELPIATAGETPPALEDGSLAIAVDRFNRHLYGTEHDYLAPVTAEDIAELELDHVRDFFEEYFGPATTVLAVSGLFESPPMVIDIEQRFADWAARFPPRLRSASGVDTDEPRQTFRYHTDKLQTWIVMGHELPEIRPHEWPALEVMNYILGGGHFDTRLFREARDRRGLTNDASGFLVRNIRGPGTYTFRTYGRPDVAQELQEIVLAEIERIQNEPVTEEDLAVARGALINGQYAMRFANGHTAARTFAEEYAKYGSFEPLVMYPRRIGDVDAGDVRNAARRYLKPERMIVVLVEGGGR